MRLALRIFTILAIAAIAAAAAIGVTLLQKPQYQSTSVLVVAGVQGHLPAEPAIRSLEALLVSPPVATDISQRAKVDLTPAQVTDRLTVTRPPTSAVLEVVVVDTDRDRSIALATNAGPALIAALQALPPSGNVNAPSAFGLVTFKPEPTTVVIDPPRLRNGAIGLGVGLLLGVAAVMWRPRRSRPIRSELDASEAFDTPLYAALPILGSGSWRSHSLDVPEELLPIGWPPAARRLVVLGSGGRPSVRLVQLLATAIAQSGRNVLLIDAEPEERGLTATFGQHGRLGFFDCLTGLTDAVGASVPLDGEDLPREMSELVPPDGGRISLLPAGDLDVSPAALAGTGVDHVLRQVPAKTTVIVHAPRVPGPFPANQFVEFADSVVVPALAGTTREDDARSVARLVTSITSAPMYVVLLTERPVKRAPRDDRRSFGDGTAYATGPEEHSTFASER